MAKGGDAMWKRYRVVWRFPGRLCGSVPTDRGLLEKWLTARAPERQSEGGLNLADLAAEAAGHIVQEEGQEFQSNGFEAVDGCLCMRTMTVRAHLKDCARAISRYLHAKETGRLSFESRVKDALYYPPEDFWIRILQDVDGNEKETFEPSGWITKPITVDVRGQKYSAIKRFAYVELAVLRFTLMVLQGAGKKSSALQDLADLMAYGGVQGYGGGRGGGEGRYFFEIEEEGNDNA